MSIIKYRFLFGFYSILIFLLSGMPEKALPSSFFHNQDKLFHFVEYFILGILTVKSIHNPSWRALSLIVLYGIIFASIDEYYQTFSPGRCASMFDVMFDVIGIGSGSAVTLWHCNKT